MIAFNAAAALGIKGGNFVKKASQQIQAANAKKEALAVKPAENKPANNSNLESRVSALESMMKPGHQMEMGSKQINTPTNFASRDLEKLYASAALGINKSFM